MRYMGIDYGTKRVGVAVSDATGAMAFPKTVLKNDDKLLSELSELVDEYEVKAVVIGHSIDKNDAPNQIQSAINEFIGDLTMQVGLPVHLEPEQYTTQAALRIQGRNDQTDASAAALILNSFLQRNHS